MTKISDILKS